MKAIVNAINGIVQSVSYEPETEQEKAMLAPVPLTITPVPEVKGKSAKR